jgi:thymidylate synthase ThyX
MYTPDKEQYKFKKYTVNINNHNITTDLRGLNSILAKVYPQLLKQGVAKEDARGFLPTNSTCGKIYITFTWENLMSFFKLRRDKAAQLEIRKYADALYDNVKDVFDVIFSAYGVDMDYLIDNINTWYLEPALFNDYDTEDIDETIEGEEAYESEDGNTEESTDE